jgi:hypothetical protein
VDFLAFPPPFYFFREAFNTITTTTTTAAAAAALSLAVVQCEMSRHYKSRVSKLRVSRAEFNDSITPRLLTLLRPVLASLRPPEPPREHLRAEPRAGSIIISYDVVDLAYTHITI